MEPQCISDARDWLSRHTALPRENRERLALLVPSLLDALAQIAIGPGVLGIGGLPGTGKSTLAQLCADLFNTQSRPGDVGANTPVQALALSLDDYYLPRAARQTLAATVHPRLAGRGVPGTHDHARLFSDIDRLRAAQAGAIRLPRFDKRTDNPSTPWRFNLQERPLLVLVEGWFLGIPPLTEHDWDAWNTTAGADDMAWRQFVAAAHEDFHEQWSRLGARSWQLLAPDWETVCRWRWQQEQDLPSGQRMLNDPQAVKQFLEPFEPLGRQQLAHAGEWADLLITLDREHLPRLQCAP